MLGLLEGKKNLNKYLSLFIHNINSRQISKHVLYFNCIALGQHENRKSIIVFISNYHVKLVDQIFL